MGSRPERETRDDHELVLRTKRADRSAFEILVSRYQDRAYNVAYQIVRHHEDALDVAQEAFARAYVSIARFRGTAGFYTWLYRIQARVVQAQIVQGKSVSETLVDTTLKLQSGGPPVVISAARNTRMACWSSSSAPLPPRSLRANGEAI